MIALKEPARASLNIRMQRMTLILSSVYLSKRLIKRFSKILKALNVLLKRLIFSIILIKLMLKAIGL